MKRRGSKIDSAAVFRWANAVVAFGAEVAGPELLRRASRIDQPAHLRVLLLDTLMDCGAGKTRAADAQALFASCLSDADGWVRYAGLVGLEQLGLSASQHNELVAPMLEDPRRSSRSRQSRRCSTRCRSRGGGERHWRRWRRRTSTRWWRGRCRRQRTWCGTGSGLPLVSCRRSSMGASDTRVRASVCEQMELATSLFCIPSLGCITWAQRLMLLMLLLPLLLLPLPPPLMLPPLPPLLLLLVLPLPLLLTQSSLQRPPEELELSSCHPTAHDCRD